MILVNGKEVFTTLEELVNPKHTALLLIDLQNDFVLPMGYFGKLGWDVSSLRKIIPRIRDILQAARHSDVLIVHVQMTLYSDFKTESPASLHARLLRIVHKSVDSIEKIPLYCSEGSWGWQIIDELTPLPNEIVVKKYRASAFVSTNLDLILRSNGIKTVTIVGCLTQGCVMGTATDTLFFDYYPVVLRDCIASYEQALHDAALLIMSKGKDVVDCEEVLEVWRRSR